MKIYIYTNPFALGPTIISRTVMPELAIWWCFETTTDLRLWSKVKEAFLVLSFLGLEGIAYDDVLKSSFLKCNYSVMNAIRYGGYDKAYIKSLKSQYKFN